MADSGYDTVRNQHYRNVEKLAVKEEQRKVRPTSGENTRDKVYSTFVRPVLTDVRKKKSGECSGTFNPLSYICNVLKRFHVICFLVRSLTSQLHSLCRNENERQAIEDLKIAFENAEYELPGITRLFVKGLSQRLEG